MRVAKSWTFSAIAVASCQSFFLLLYARLNLDGCGMLSPSRIFEIFPGYSSACVRTCVSIFRWKWKSSNSKVWVCNFDRIFLRFMVGLLYSWTWHFGYGERVTKGPPSGPKLQLETSRFIKKFRTLFVSNTEKLWWRQSFELYIFGN